MLMKEGDYSAAHWHLD